MFSPYIIVNKLFTILITLFGVALIVFVVLRLAPGDPIALLVGPGASDEDIASLRALYGLDKSIIHQFFIWLGKVVQGDLGISISLRQNVADIVLSRLPATLELSLLALIFSLILGGGISIIGVLYRNSKVEVIIDIIKGFILSIPDFLWGLVLILLFGVFFAVFPISGRISPHLEFDFITGFYLLEALLRLRFDIVGDLLSHMLMPAIALALPLSAVFNHLLKQSLKEEMLRDYATLAVARGNSDLRIITREAMPNAILSTLTLTGVQFCFLIGNTVIIERLFSYEGLGNLAIDALINRDFPLIQGIILQFAIIFIIINIIIDILHLVFDPKLRRKT